MTSTKAPASKVFRGEGDALIDALVEACKSENRPSLECPVLPHLIGRALTPYFGSSEPTSVLDAAPEGKTSAGNKRKGSPPNLTRNRSTSPQPADMLVGAILTVPSNSSKMQRSSKHTPEKPTSSISKSQDVSTVVKKKKNYTLAMLDSALATAMRLTTSGSSYACPAIFSSPRPETLPMPTSRLLMRAASVAA